MPPKSNRAKKKELYALGHAELAQFAMEKANEAERLRSQLLSVQTAIKKEWKENEELTESLLTAQAELKAKEELHKEELSEMNCRIIRWMERYYRSLCEKFRKETHAGAGNGAGDHSRSSGAVTVRSDCRDG